MPQRQSGAYAENVLLASAARTTTGTEEWTGFGQVSTLRVFLNVTAVSGTSPNLTVFIEDTLDGTNWFPIATFAAKTAAGTEILSVTIPFTDRIRARWTITGTTPSFTFALTAASQTPTS